MTITLTEKKLNPVTLTTEERAEAESILATVGRAEPQHLPPTGKENVTLLADVIEYAAEELHRAKRARRQDRTRSRFNMDVWSTGVIFKDDKGQLPPPSCGTAGCLAGTAVALTLPEDQLLSYGEIFKVKGRTADGYPLRGAWVGDVQPAARRELGLSLNQSRALFYLTPGNLGIIDPYGEQKDEPNEIDANIQALDAIRLIATYLTGYDFRQVGV